MFTNEINKRQEHERPGDYRSHRGAFLFPAQFK